MTFVVNRALWMQLITYGTTTFDSERMEAVSSDPLCYERTSVARRWRQRRLLWQVVKGLL